MNAVWFGCFCLLLPAIVAASPAMTPQELDDWFNSKGATEVNEGQLRFLTTAPAKAVHHHQNRIVISPDSLKTGWAALNQCHDHLDAVPLAQITFRDGYIRELRVTETRLIGQAWVEGASVQLRDVQHGARLCLAAETRALSHNGDGYYKLSNGPYMRKFLDGYYPMRVSLELDYPANLLQLVDIAPANQSGFTLRQSPGRLSIDTLFEGELRIEARFLRN